MPEVISLLKPYAAYALIDPDADGDPYFMLMVHCNDGSIHGLPRKLISGFAFHPDKGEGQRITIHHDAAGDVFLYGVNLQPVWPLLRTIHDLIVFNPNYHQPVTDSSVPIFTRTEIKDSDE